MILESRKEQEEVKYMKKSEMLLFGFAVSIDSFSVGITLPNITNQYLLSSIIFSICSFLFTYIGLLLGSKINKIIGSLSTLIGGIFLILVGILYVI